MQAVLSSEAIYPELQMHIRSLGRLSTHDPLPGHWPSETQRANRTRVPGNGGMENMNAFTNLHVYMIYTYRMHLLVWLVFSLHRDKVYNDNYLFIDVIGVLLPHSRIFHLYVGGQHCGRSIQGRPPPKPITIGGRLQDLLKNGPPKSPWPPGHRITERLLGHILRYKWMKERRTNDYSLTSDWQLFCYTLSKKA